MSAGLLLALIPIIAIELALTIFALVDLMKAERQVKGGSKVLWVLIIVLINFIGPVIYLTVGREAEKWDDSQFDPRG